MESIINDDVELFSTEIDDSDSESIINEVIKHNATNIFEEHYLDSKKALDIILEQENKVMFRFFMENHDFNPFSMWISRKIADYLLDDFHTIDVDDYDFYTFIIVHFATVELIEFYDDDSKLGDATKINLIIEKAYDDITRNKTNYIDLVLMAQYDNRTTMYDLTQNVLFDENVFTKIIPKYLFY